jgi:hypothetical protein
MLPVEDVEVAMFSALALLNSGFLADVPQQAGL